MCSILCDKTKWIEDPKGCPMSSEVVCGKKSEIIKNEDTKTEAKMNGEGTPPPEDALEIPELRLPATPQHVSRQDSGVPEDLSSASNKTSPENDEDETNTTMNSDCNITVIHVTDGLNENKDKDNKDGSDSGVEGCLIEMPRVNGYSSSINNLDEVSCDSSLVSTSSVYEDPCGTLAEELLPQTPPLTHSRTGEHTSEGGSESSSVTGSTGSRPTPRSSKRVPSAPSTATSTKKKPTKSDPVQKSSRTRVIPQTESPRPKSRALTPKTGTKQLQTPKNWNTTAPARPKSRTRPTPESLTLSIASPLAKELDKDLSQRSLTRATSSSLSKCRTTPLSTPSEDCKRPMSAIRPQKALGRSLTADKSKTEAQKLESKTIDTFGTLPRRRTTKLSVTKAEEPKKVLSRDGSLSRIEKNRKKSVPKPIKSERILIYHEVSVQTGLTAPDIEKLINGLLLSVSGPEVPDRLVSACQTEVPMVPEATYQALKAEFDELKKEKEKIEQKLIVSEKKLADELSDHQFTRAELERNLQRVQAILGNGDRQEGNDSLLELESHFQESGQVVAKQQVEIANLQSYSRMLNRDLEKSLAAQKTLLQHQQDVEAETLELQEFLHLEKTAMAEAMKEMEVELMQKKQALETKDEDLRRKTDENKHLLRISEQRRQENLTLEMRMSAVERKCRDLLLTEGAAISGAAVALSGLGSRLDGLVDQLVKSYKISEKDLEDVVYHNEAYSKSNSSAESSPVSSRSLKDLVPSPKRQSFVSAVIGAIRNAATHPFVVKDSKRDASKGFFKDFRAEDSEDLLDFETEPYLMMESVLEDVPVHDGYSRNMVSSCDSLRRGFSVPEGVLDSFHEDAEPMQKSLDDFSSLNSLTQAILNRKCSEDHEETEPETEGEEEDESGDGRGQVECCTAVNLVDQVIDVDNLVTKLLKVLRIIQLENDTCIKELRDEKGELQGRLAIMGRRESTSTEKNEGITS